MDEEKKENTPSEETSNENVEVLDIENETNEEANPVEENSEPEEIIDIEEKPQTKEPPVKEKVVEKEVVKEVVKTETKNNDKKNKKDEPKNDNKNNDSKNVENQTQNTEEPKVIKEKEVVVKKSNLASILVLIIVFILLIGAVIALPYVADFFNKEDKPVSTPNTNVNSNIDDENQDKEFVSGIDVKATLEDLKKVKSYMYENETDIYVKDEKDENLSIKIDNIFSFNETKYKIESSRIIADLTYETIDYSEKLDDKYYDYLNDITTKEYTKVESSKEKFETVSNLFPNMIDYLLDNYSIEEEKQIKVDDEDHINIKLKTKIDLLKNLSFETGKLDNKIDISKLSTSDIIIDMYFDENKDIYKIEFSVEDKNIYQGNVETEGEIESAISKYTFDSFNEIKDITLPSI